MDRILDDIRVFKHAYPDARYYLDFDTPYHLVLATILSAQCTDVIVNRTTPALFSRYQKPEDLMDEPVEKVASIIRAVTFAQAKAKYLVQASQLLVNAFGGAVPREIPQLMKLPGVGRKTANAIQQNAFNLVNGIIVDTHVIRLSQRLGWTKEKNPEKIEKELMEKIPKAEWKHLPHLLKNHGQRVCTAQRARCESCLLSKTCPSAFKA